MGSGDIIDLSQAGVSSFIGTAAFSGAGGAVRHQMVGANTFVYGDVDGNGSPTSLSSSSATRR